MSDLASHDGLVPFDSVEPEPVQDTNLAEPPSPLEWLIGLGPAFAAWLFACVSSARGYVVSPVYDMHSWLTELFEAERNHRLLAFFWLPHSNQRIVFSRFFTWWDAEVMHGHGPSSFLVSGLALQLLVALAAAATALIALPQSRARPWLGALIGLVLANIAFTEDVCLHNYGVYIEAAGFSVLAILAFALRGGDGWRRAMTPLAVVCGVFAMFGNAAGLAVWPVLVVSAVRARADRRTLTIVAVAAVLVIGMAMAGLGAPTGDGRGMASPLKIASYFCGFLTLPWGVMPNLPLRLIGAALAAVYVYLLVVGMRRRECAVAGAAGLDLMTFALITAALAGVGRVNELPEPIVPVRYAPFAMAGHVGLILALAPRLAAWLEPRGRAILAAAAAAVILVAFVVNEVQGARRVEKTVAVIRAASDAFDRGDRSPAVIANVLPANPPFAAAVRAEAKRRGLPY